MGLTGPALSPAVTRMVGLASAVTRMVGLASALVSVEASSELAGVGMAPKRVERTAVRAG